MAMVPDSAQQRTGTGKVLSRGRGRAMAGIVRRTRTLIGLWPAAERNCYA